MDNKNQKPQNSGGADYLNKIITIPNILSAFRLCLIPVFVWFYSVTKRYNAATLILILSGLTDIADGYIARHFHMISNFGKILDPIADKLTQITVLFCMLFRFPVMLILLALLIFKEVFDAVMGLIVIRRTGKVCGAEWHGKTATILLYIMMGLHLVWSDIPFAASNICIAVCAGILILSLILYTTRNVRLIKSVSKEEQK